MSFLALSGRESSLVQTFCESCEQLDITHPSVHMTWRFVIQGCPTLNDPISHLPPAWVFCDRYYLQYLHVSDGRTSDKCHEHSDERNANKRNCILHRIYFYIHVMSVDPSAIMFVNLFHEKYVCLCINKG